MPGPAPSPNARRRNNRADWRTIQARYDGPVPKWPLAGRSLAGQADLWREVWPWPQALVWSEQKAERLVARYVQKVLMAERTSATAAEQSVVIQLEDGLLITPDKLLKARILAAPAEKAEKAKPAPSNVTDLDEYRSAGLG
jgi:hypothetical protein